MNNINHPEWRNHFNEWQSTKADRAADRRAAWAEIGGGVVMAVVVVIVVVVLFMIAPRGAL